MSHRFRLYLAALTAATLLAAVSRVWHIWVLPPPGWVDEVWYNLRARDLLQTGEFQVFYRTFWGGMHPLMVNLAAVVQAAGFNSPVASRLVAALGGVLTVPLAFACFNEVLRREEWPTRRRRLVAGLIALILSNLFYLTLAGRIGYGPALLPPLTLWCVWQLRLAGRTGYWLNWVMAGLALGLAQYLNLNGRFLVLLISGLALHDLYLTPRRRPLIVGLSLAAGVAILIATPLILFFINEPQWFLARGRAVTAGEQTLLGLIAGNTLKIALAFNFWGDPIPRHNLPYRPMLDVVQSVGFIIGLLWVARHARRSPMARDVALWLSLTVLPSLITSDAPQFERLSGAAVPVAAITALGWAIDSEWIARAWVALHPATRHWRWPVGLGLVCVSLGLNAYDLFVRYPHTPGLAEAMTATPMRLAQDLITRSATEAVFVERIPEAEDVYAFDFLFPNTPVERLDFRQCLPLADARPTRTIYVILAERDQTSVTDLLGKYPLADVHWLMPEAAALMGRTALIELAPDTLAPPLGQAAHAHFAPGLTLVGYTVSSTTVAAGESVFLTFYWKAETPFAEDLTAFVHLGTGLAGTSIVAQRDGAPCQGLYPTSHWRTGDVVPDSFALIIPPTAPPGTYPLTVGWYRYPSLERLPLLTADAPLPDQRAVIGTLNVSAP